MSVLLHLTDDLRLACPRCEWVSLFVIERHESVAEVVSLARLHDLIAHAPADLAAEAEALTKETHP